jgi:N12 class adenine-specific DNA methylase
VVPHWGVSAGDEEELTALTELRDTTKALLDAEASDLADSPEMGRLRAQLNAQYDAYVAKYGPINRFTWRNTGRTKKVEDPATGQMVDTGEAILSQQRPRRGGFSDDPQSVVVDALESFDTESGRAIKADIFRKRVVAPRALADKADNPDDALALTLDRLGRVDLAEVARLLGTDQDTARKRLGTSVFDVPGEPNEQGVPGPSPRIVPAAEYLAGNVRAKLRVAEAAAAVDDKYQANVDSLRAALPRDLTPEEIDARPGATWISPEHMTGFAQEVLRDRYAEVTYTEADGWKVTGAKYGAAATVQWGTTAKPAGELLEDLLNQKPIIAKKTVWDEIKQKEKRVPDPDATTEAQDKADELVDRFSEWVWEDPDRARELSTVYNDKFNSLVLRNYDGLDPVTPGLSSMYQLRPHQQAAVARIVSEPSVLLAHEVGAGKTLEMAVGAMELRRLGMSRKPAIVIPNHMLAQFSKEFLEAYPQAKLLAAGGDDLKGDKRRKLVARAATGDWDAIILTQGAFARMQVSEQARKAYMDDVLRPLREKMERLEATPDDGSKRRETAIKAAETRFLKAEEALKKRLTVERDNAVSFEQTGIDYLMVDEAHMYKNLHNPSEIEGAAVEGSTRASDLEMKLKYLRDTTNSNRVVTFATATPISNSMVEAYTMMRYLRPDLLKDAGINDFDDWAANFGSVVQDMEMSPDGNSFRMKSRFAKFRNAPELLRIFHTFADVKTAEDLNLPTPQLQGGKANIISVPASDAQMELIRDLGERADLVRSRQPRTFLDANGEVIADNMLKISGDGRRAALDMRVQDVNADPEGSGQKLTAAAENITRIYEETKDQRYLIDAKNRDLGFDELPGGMQIVFMDQGTPGKKARPTFDAYADLKQKLIDRGVPAEKIRFIHEATNDRQKGELFAAARAGKISVLIGSTEKMGVGTNVQRRAVHLHHMDVPWKPADLQQRDGRILRQGNYNPSIGITNYVTEGTFDSYSWGIIERKAKFIQQIMKGRLDQRDIEDVGDSALSAAEAKAIAAGNPMLLEQARLNQETQRLTKLDRAHRRTQANVKRDVVTYRNTISQLEQQIADLEEALPRRQDTSGDKFTINVETGTRWEPRPERFDKRTEAGQALASALHGVYGDDVQVGQLGGFDLVADKGWNAAGSYSYWTVSFRGVPMSGVVITQKELNNPGAGMIQRLENQLGRMDGVLWVSRGRLTDTRSNLDIAEATVGKDFAGEDLLRAAKRRKHAIDTVLTYGSRGHLDDDDQATLDQARTDLETLPTVEEIAAGRTKREPKAPEAAAAPTPPPAPEPAPAPAPAAPETPPAPDGQAEAVPQPDVPAPATEPTPEPAPEPTPEPAEPASGDVVPAVDLRTQPGGDGTSVVADGEVIGTVSADSEGQWEFDTASGNSAGVGLPDQAAAVAALGDAAAEEAASTPRPLGELVPAEPKDQPDRSGVTAMFTQRNVTSIIGDELTRQGVTWEADGPGFLVNGEQLTPGQAAERYYPGGWDAAWNARSLPETGTAPEAAPGTAAGKITATRITPGMRVMVVRDPWDPAGRLSVATTKGKGTYIATVISADRVLPENARRREQTRIRLHTDIGEVLDAGASQTFWLADGLNEKTRQAAEARTAELRGVVAPDEEPAPDVTPAVTEPAPAAAADVVAEAERGARQRAENVGQPNVDDQRRLGLRLVDQLGKFGDITPENVRQDMRDRGLVEERDGKLQLTDAGQAQVAKPIGGAGVPDAVPLPPARSRTDLPERPDASDGELNVMHDVVQYIDRLDDPELGGSQIGLNNRSVESAIANGYLRREDTGDPSTDGGRYRLHLTEEGRRQLELDDAHRDATQMPRRGSDVPRRVTGEQRAAETAVEPAKTPEAAPEPGVAPVVPQPAPQAPEAAPEADAGTVADREPGHIGQPGQQVSHVRVTITDLKPMKTRFGQTTLVTMVTPGGDILKWFAPSKDPVADQWNVGDDAEIAATVKKHDVYGGVPQTMLNFVSLRQPTEDDGEDGPDPTLTDDPADVETPAPADVPTPDIAAGEGDVARGVTFRVQPHGVVLDGDTFPAKDAIRQAGGFQWREVPGGGTDRNGRPVKKWTAAGTPEEQQAALTRLRGILGPDEPDESEAFPPTEQQQAVIDAVATGDDVVVRALAGTGKTSTLQMIARRMQKSDPRRRIIYVAFNKSIQLEADRKMPPNVESRTGDSLAFTSMPDGIKNKFGDKTTLRRPDQIAEYLGITGDLPLGDGRGSLSPEEQAAAVVRTIENYSISADDNITADHLPPSVRGDRDAENALVAWAQGAWNQDLKAADGRLRITNSHITKMWALTRPDLGRRGSGVKQPAQVIFFDEAQDINPVMGKVIADQNLQRVYVGDSNQAIYGFRGSTDELDQVQVDHDLPLTKSWRFGPAVAEIGNRYLQMLDSPHRVEGAGGESTVLPSGSMDQPDAVLVRSNAGAIGEILTAQNAGRIVGVPKGTKADLRRLVDTARWLQGQGRVPTQPHDDLAAFRSWDEAQREADKGDDAKLSMLVRIINDNGLDLLDRLVDNLVDAGDTADTRTPDLTVTTAHKAKGLEWNRVKIGPDFRGPRTDPRTGEVVMPPPEEFRLAYVAVTRARKELDPGSLDWVNEYTDENGGAPGTPARAPDAVDVAAPEPAAAADPLAEFSPAEQAQIRLAVSESAGYYAAGPGGDPARYVAEGPLRDLTDQYGLPRMTETVRDVIAADPSVLNNVYGPTEREARAQTRRDAAQQLGQRVGEAFRAGEYEQAFDLVDEAERTAPDFRPSGMTFDEFRAALRRAQPAQATTPEDMQARADRLRRFTEQGPSYDRGITENLARFDRMMAAGNRTDEAAHWLDEAERDAQRRQGRDTAPEAAGGDTGGGIDGVEPAGPTPPVTDVDDTVEATPAEEVGPGDQILVPGDAEPVTVTAVAEDPADPDLARVDVTRTDGTTDEVSLDQDTTVTKVLPERDTTAAPEAQPGPQTPAAPEVPAAPEPDEDQPEPTRPAIPSEPAPIGTVAPGDRIADTSGGEMTIIGIRRERATGQRVLSLVNEDGASGSSSPPPTGSRSS